VNALRGGRDPPPSILPPPQRPRQPGRVLGSCGTRSRLVRGWRVRPRGGAWDEGGRWRRDCHPGGSRKGGIDQHCDRVNALRGERDTLPPRFFPLPRTWDCRGAFAREWTAPAGPPYSTATAGERASAVLRLYSGIAGYQSNGGRRRKSRISLELVRTFILFAASK